METATGILAMNLLALTRRSKSHPFPKGSSLLRYLLGKFSILQQRLSWPR